MYGIYHFWYSLYTTLRMFIKNLFVVFMNSDEMILLMVKCIFMWIDFVRFTCPRNQMI